MSVPDNGVSAAACDQWTRPLYMYIRYVIVLAAYAAQKTIWFLVESVKR